MIRKIELQGSYSIVVENDPDKRKTMIGVENWQLIFITKQEAEDFIELMRQAIEFWGYDDETNNKP